MSTITEDYYGNAVVRASFVISIKEITEVLHGWLVNTGAEKVDKVNKIPAIKYIREYYKHLGLREAKDAVEYIQESDGDEWVRNREARNAKEAQIRLTSDNLTALRIELEILEERVWPSNFPHYYEEDD